MSDEKRQKCCRLCLAPDSECISILNSYAADKEPLTTKIYNCVHIKINTNDRLSLRICHACISYLNSWQSFKNRCLASQNKQQLWLDNKQYQQDATTIAAQEPTEDQHDAPSSLTSSILDGITSLKKRKSLTVYVSPKQQSQQQKQQDFQKQQLTKPCKPKRQYIRHQKSPMPFPILQSVLPARKISKPRMRRTHKEKPKETVVLRQMLEQTPPPLCAALMPEILLQPDVTQSQQQKQQQQVQPPPQQQQQQQSPQFQQQQQQQNLATISTFSTFQLPLSGSPITSSVATTTLTTATTASCCSTSTEAQSSAQQLRLFRRYSSYNPLPAVQIKEEPYDSDDAYGLRQQQHHEESDDMVDPTLFLERTEEEGDEPLDGALYGYPNQQQPIPAVPVATTIDPVKQASCRACNLKFSTRANARRHERTLHPNLFELSTSTPNNTPITKPTAAFAAILAGQRNAATPIVATTEQHAPPKRPVKSEQKYRQEVVNAFKICETGGYDYDSPEKYQHLLTDEKIVFLQQNEEFLQQYQNMTCRCCNKYHTTYKNFMAHMRKRYATLPRNLCFNCLKLNDSKALFISHLKRRNCINLYKVLHALMIKNADFAAAVKATAAAVPEKLRAKDLLVNKMYECKLCPKQFRLKLEFRTHVYDEHSDAQQKDVSSTGCCFCAMEIDDPAERKRHHNNMECIVTLRCLTCEAKFDNHQKFIEHVYEKHLADIGDSGAPQLTQLPTQQFGSADNSPGKKNSGGGGSSADESRSNHSAAAPQKSQYFSRMPQACPICGQQYNNYNNVLRHMESKHPDQLPQTYKCVKCGTGYPRLSNLREHMVTAHAGDKTRHTGFEYIVNADAVKIADGGNSASNAYSGRYDYVMKDLMSITNGGTTADDDDADEEQAPKKMRMDGNGGNQFSSLKECPICSAVFSNNIGLSNHMRSHTAAAQNAQAAAMAARIKTPNSLTITATSGNGTTSKHAAAAAAVQKQQQQQQQTAALQQEAVFKRSLEQAADRRFRRMRCRMCQRRFSSKKSYRFHMLNDHQIRNVQFIKCKLCDAEFAYEKGLKVHMFKIHNTLLRDEMIVKQYECDVCSTVYRSEQQLLQHKQTTHGKDSTLAHDNDETGGGGDTNSLGGADLSGISTPISGVESSSGGTAGTGPLYWYQCKYCPSNFNTNKKLAIHINSHDEFDSKDYSCKDCGNVYSGRKSLWVHRYKKHPQIAEPSECVLCKKVFFDSQMLENHIPTCNRKPISTTIGTESVVYRHKTGDDEDDENSNEMDDDTNAASGIPTSTLGGGELEVTAIPSGNVRIRLPEVACTMCGQRFTDQELFTKHIQMHEQELYTDNPLASMFDTGPSDPNQFYLDCVNDMGEYACDLCTKTFTQMTALKVHRKWHFRGDNKQNPTEGDANFQPPLSSSTQINHPHLLDLQAMGLVPNSALRSQKRKRELKCEYCASTFISNNNLRRHMFELHKDEVTNLPKAPKIATDPPLQCRRCDMRFETKRDWIEHKVADARVTKPFGPFQWGCDLCGAYVSRKEKLINHIQNHMKESTIVTVDEQSAREETTAQARSLLKSKLTARQTTPSSENTMSATATRHNKSEEVDNEQDDEVADGDEEQEADGYEEQDENVQNGDEDDDEEEEEEDEEAEADDDDENGDDDDDDDDSDDSGENDDDDSNSSNSDEEGETEQSAAAANTADTRATTTKLVPPITIKRNNTIAANAVNEDSDDEDDEGDGEDEDGVGDADDLIEEVDEDDDMDDEMEDDADSRSSAPATKPTPPRRFACDLCQVFFDSQQELQKHVKMHFLNGPGSVSLTEIKSKSMSKSSTNSGGDVVAVSSS